ncbi:MAG: PilZ domain-containing protein [Polyangiaceae bacterium]
MEKKGNATPEQGVSSSVTAPNVGQDQFAEGQTGQTGPAARTRRTDARRGVSEKITVCALKDGSAGAVVTTGWALNMSRSGVRAILEERILAGVEYEVTIGEVGTSQLTRKARVVWVQEEHDGVVVGLEFFSPTSTGEIPVALLVPRGDGEKRPEVESGLERDTEKNLAAPSDDSGPGNKDR